MQKVDKKWKFSEMLCISGTQKSRMIFMEKEPEVKEGEVVDYERPERPADYKPAGNVLELLDRILDKGVVIVGDIRISVADIELLKIQIRLLIASVDKAKELGIDFSWAQTIESTKSKEQLQSKVNELEAKLKEKGKTG